MLKRRDALDNVGSLASFDGPIAHTSLVGDHVRLQPLEEHLVAVAGIARRAGESFGAGDWAELAGLWHDLGKYSAAFQDYLKRTVSADVHVAEQSGIDHSTAGAQHAVDSIDVMGHVLGYAISGHHSGLLDALGTGACLQSRLEKVVEPWTAAPDHITTRTPSALPPFVRSALGTPDAGFTLAFFTRMIFSCLVDADFLDTEAFMDPWRGEQRPSRPSDILGQLEASLDGYVDGIALQAREEATKAPGREGVMRARADVRAACLVAAEREPGFFALSVPTGGGKTLSSLAFALRHAALHSKKRIVYVIPFTSIVEQAAATFRMALRGVAGVEDLVVEHHSNLDWGKQTTTSRLAAENWDAPLIVTTSVQFYESLFADRSSRCRKLHRLAESIVILDEAQTLPVDFLAPCLRALRELTSNYGATVVLCTATQPAIHEREGFGIGLRGVREIVPDRAALYEDLKRVAVSDLGVLTDADLTARLGVHSQALCIVNTRHHARRVYDALSESTGIYHLSGLMCPVHRSAMLDRIRESLDERAPCLVVSTQLIEAGVDIDFPVVYRSMAGVDSIAQAAGRCNREGALEVGEVFVFQSEHGASERFLSDTTNCGRQVLELYPDPLTLEAIEHYFRLYYWDQSDRWDARKIVERFRLDRGSRTLPLLFGFRSAANDFRLIEDYGRPVIIPWRAEGRKLCDELIARDETAGRRLQRRLQRYTVQIPRRTWDANIGKTIELVHDRYPVLSNPDAHYSNETGLTLDEVPLQFLGF